MTQERALDEQKAKARKTAATPRPDKRHTGGAEAEASGLIRLQQQVGNRTVQRLLAQRSGEGAFELDDSTAGRINHERGGGQALDGSIQRQAGAAMGHDLSGVRVHTSPEADSLSHQLGAKAFATGEDVFFREGTYDPHSSGGQELIAHELTHVVQQSSGAVPSSGRLAVNAPGDAFEQEADTAARAVAVTGATQVQRQVTPLEEEEPPVQAKAEEGVLRRQPVPAEEEEEPPIQAKAEEGALQMQAEAVEEDEEPPIQMQAAERLEEEDRP